MDLSVPSPTLLASLRDKALVTALQHTFNRRCGRMVGDPESVGQMRTEKSASIRRNGTALTREANGVYQDLSCVKCTCVSSDVCAFPGQWHFVLMSGNCCGRIGRPRVQLVRVGRDRYCDGIIDLCMTWRLPASIRNGQSPPPMTRRLPFASWLPKIATFL